MGARKHPLELILRAHGTAELVDRDDTVLWVSDSDDTFKEEFTDEFLNEEDSDEILEYLLDEGILTEMEYNAFNSDRWDVNVETLKSSVGEPDDDYDDFDDEYDDELGDRSASRDDHFADDE